MFFAFKRKFILKGECAMLQYIFFIAIGFALLIMGADILVDGASSIAKKYKIPQIIIGLTIVSIGTSMPELIVSITSAIDGHPDLSIGNFFGNFGVVIKAYAYILSLGKENVKW